MTHFLRASLSFLIAVALSGGAVASAQTTDELFNSGALNDIKLMLHSADWQKLKDTYKENTYYPADITWGGNTVRNVGIRSRGLGSRHPLKPGLRVDFDRYSSGQRFLGLKSVVLDNLTQDPSMMKEVVAMELFARMGLAAPRETFVRLYVNNTLVGLYGLVEAVDKQFLERVFGENDGNLYEYDYTFDYNLEYLGSELDRYGIFKPQTNTSHSPFDLFGGIERMVRTAGEASDAAFESAMAEFIDLRTFVRYVAVENYIADDDGWLGIWGMNNFYMYQFEDRTQFQIISWDKDYTFLRAEHPIFERVDRNVLMRRAIQIPALREIYLRTLAELADNASEGQQGGDAITGWMGRTVDRLYAMIASDARTDTNKPYTNAQFEEAAQTLRNYARYRPWSVRCQIAAEAPALATCAQ